MGCSHFCVPFFCKSLAFRSEQGLCCDWWMSLRNVCGNADCANAGWSVILRVILVTVAVHIAKT